MFRYVVFIFYVKSPDFYTPPFPIIIVIFSISKSTCFSRDVCSSFSRIISVSVVNLKDYFEQTKAQPNKYSQSSERCDKKTLVNCCQQISIQLIYYVLHLALFIYFF